MALTGQARNEATLAEQGLLSDVLTQFRQSIKPKKPWDNIIDFATHPSFTGLRLYPRQQTLLKLIYLETENMTGYDLEVIDEWTRNFGNSKSPYGVQPDIWERVEYLKSHGFTHFPHVLGVQGRRASKGMVGGILGAERMGHMVYLDDPQSHYGIAEGKDLFLHVVATNSVQAKRFLFADIRQAVEQNKTLSKYISTSKEYYLSLRTPADLRAIADLRVRGVRADREIASVRALAMSSVSSSGRGGTAFCLDPDTPVLTTFGYIKLRELKIGQEIWGVEEHGQHRPVKTTVEAKTTVRKPAFRITFDDGTSVVCSEDHKWLDEEGNWREARDFRVGDNILEFEGDS